MLTDPSKVVCELCDERFRWDEEGSECGNCGAEYVFLRGDTQEGLVVTPAWGGLVLDPVWVLSRIKELELAMGELVDAQNGVPSATIIRIKAWYSAMIKVCTLLKREDCVAVLTEQAESWRCD